MCRKQSTDHITLCLRSLRMNSNDIFKTYHWQIFGLSHSVFHSSIKISFILWEECENSCYLCEYSRFEWGLLVLMWGFLYANVSMYLIRTSTEYDISAACHGVDWKHPRVSNLAVILGESNVCGCNYSRDDVLKQVPVRSQWGHPRVQH